MEHARMRILATMWVRPGTLWAWPQEGLATSPARALCMSRAASCGQRLDSCAHLLRRWSCGLPWARAAQRSEARRLPSSGRPGARSSCASACASPGSLRLRRRRRHPPAAAGQPSCSRLRSRAPLRRAKANWVSVVSCGPELVASSSTVSKEPFARGVSTESAPRAGILGGLRTAGRRICAQSGRSPKIFPAPDDGEPSRGLVSRLRGGGVSLLPGGGGKRRSVRRRVF